MDKIDSLNQVARFHQTFQHPILNEPQIPSKERCDLRLSLIDEETGNVSGLYLLEGVDFLSLWS